MNRQGCRERWVESYLVKRVKEVGGKAYKFNSMTCKGVADRLVLLPNGKIFFIELKSPVGKQTKLQQVFEQDVIKLGQKYLLINSRDAVNEFIKQEVEND